MTSLTWIESEPSKPQPAKVGASVLDLVGPGEVADRLDVQRATVAQWRARGLLPEPLGVIDQGNRQIPGNKPSAGIPIWSWSSIRDWATATGRPIKGS